MSLALSAHQQEQAIPCLLHRHHIASANHQLIWGPENLTTESCCQTLIPLHNCPPDAVCAKDLMVAIIDDWNVLIQCVSLLKYSLRGLWTPLAQVALKCLS